MYQKNKKYVYCKAIYFGCIEEYREHSISTDGDGTWYPQACRFLKLDHLIHYFAYINEKSIIERIMQYIKKTEPKALTTSSHAERRNAN